MADQTQNPSGVTAAPPATESAANAKNPQTAPAETSPAQTPPADALASDSGSPDATSKTTARGARRTTVTVVPPQGSGTGEIANNESPAGEPPQGEPTSPAGAAPQTIAVKLETDAVAAHLEEAAQRIADTEKERDDARAEVARLTDESKKIDEERVGSDEGGRHGEVDTAEYGDGVARLRMPLIWIRDRIRDAGRSVSGLFTREQHEEALVEIEIEGADEPKDLVPPDHWRWLSEDSGEGPASAVDPHGNWSIDVYPDGSVEIVRYAVPNLLNRPNGVVVTGDQRLRVDSVGDFVGRLNSGVLEGSAIVEQSLDRIGRERAALAQAREEADPESPAPARDLALERIRAYADAHGIVGVPDSELPYVVATGVFPDQFELFTPLLDGDGRQQKNPFNEMPLYGGRVDWETARDKVAARLDELIESGEAALKAG